MSPSEDSYGRLKRQAFVEAAIHEAAPGRVLDFGCGTGTQLTYPLALTFSGTSFIGVDTDRSTINWAKESTTLANLTFGTPGDLAPDDRFDMIIASEVLEHVENPDQFLRDLYKYLADGGYLVLTVPNGYGPFETMALLETVLTLSGILPLLRHLKSLLLGGARRHSVTEPITLAASPHINFFTLKSVHELLEGAGFATTRFRSRTVLCGFVFDWFVRGRLAHWNSSLGDRLPPWCASDWMFVCGKATSPVRAAAWRPNWWGRLRRRLSERRWLRPTGIESA